jgi:hypothetical protein
MVAVVAKLPIVGRCKIRRKTVALIRDFCENQAAGIDAKWKLACSGQFTAMTLSRPSRAEFSSWKTSIRDPFKTFVSTCGNVCSGLGTAVTPV